MKKLFVAVLAIAAAVACNTAEIVDVPNGAPIQFDNAFVQNATRVGFNNQNPLEAFDVWAYIENKGGIVLVDEDVTKGNGQWGYANLQYWAPCQDYYFTALAPMNSANWDYNQAADVVTFTNVDGTEDLLYAYKMVNTDGLELGGSMEAVKLDFAHLLSKVNFTFTNGFATDNVSVAIKGVTMTAVKNAEVKIVEGTATWSNNVAADLTLAFGDVANLASAASAKSAELLTIPTKSDYTYGIKFYVDVYFGTVKAIKDHEFNSTLTGIEFAQGKAYNLAATINAENLKMPVIEFDVNEVKGWIDQDINAGVIGSEIVVVDTIEKLQAALNAATGNTAIAVGANLVGNVTVPELAKATIAINGNGYKFDGTFALVGGTTYGEGTTLIENFNFETAGLNGYDAFIYCNEQKGDTRYPDNVTIKDCTFKGDANAVAAKFRSLKGNLVIENVTVEGHSLLQLTSCGEANVLVDGAKVNAGRGISLGATNNATIRNSSIVAESYGIRANGCETVTNIENTTIEAVQPIVVRSVNVDGYTLNVDDASVLTTAEAYHIVFTAGADDAAYVAPSVEFSLVCPADYVVYPNNAVSNVDDLRSALKDESKSIIVLQSDVDVTSTSTPWVNIAREVTITTNGNALKVGNAANYGLFCNAGANVTLEDANVLAAGGAIVARDGATLTVNSGTYKIESSSTSHRHMIYAYGNGTVVTINGGEFSFDAYRKRTYGYVADGAVLNITGGVFGVAPNHPSDANAPFMVDGGQINITGGTFGFDPSAWVPMGYKAVKNGNTWTVAEAEIEVVASAAALTAALNRGAGIVSLTENTDFGTVTLGKLNNVVIYGAEGSTVIFDTTAETKLQNVILSAVNFVYNGSNTNCGVVINADAQIENLVLDGCTFAGTGAKAGRGIYGQNPNATIVLKNCVFENLGYPVYTMSAGGYKSLTVENCTFSLIKSWAIMPQYGEYLGDLTVTGCTFENCTGGLVKAGAFTAGHIFTFTNNTINNSAEHSAKNWFTINTSAATAVVSGNVKDGAAWTPGAAEGLN